MMADSLSSVSLWVRYEDSDIILLCHRAWLLFRHHPPSSRLSNYDREEPVLCPTTVLEGNKPFSLLLPVAVSVIVFQRKSRYTGANKFFSSAIFSNRTISEGCSNWSMPLGIPVHGVFRFGQVEIIDAQFPWCTDEYALFHRHILWGCRRHCYRLARCCIVKALPMIYLDLDRNAFAAADCRVFGCNWEAFTWTICFNGISSLFILSNTARATWNLNTLRSG